MMQAETNNANHKIKWQLRGHIGCIFTKDNFA